MFALTHTWTGVPNKVAAECIFTAKKKDTRINIREKLMNIKNFKMYTKGEDKQVLMRKVGYHIVFSFKH